MVQTDTIYVNLIEYYRDPDHPLETQLEFLYGTQMTMPEIYKVKPKNAGVAS